MKVFDFNASLEVGQRGERLFYNLFKHEVEYVNTPHMPDFRVIKNGSYAELKTDMYEKPKNFFMERYSDESRGTPGGPWQALAKGAEHFVYFFLDTKEVYRFDTKDLISQINKIKSLEPKRMNNGRYTTMGYAIPRSRLTHIKYKDVSQRITN